MNRPHRARSAGACGGPRRRHGHPAPGPRPRRRRLRRAVERRAPRRRSATPTGRTPRRARASSPPTPSAAPVRGSTCTASATGSTSSTRPAARLAREVADEHGILVAGDLGPTGELIAPLGTMDAAEAQAIFDEQLAGLRDGGIDVVLIETMSDLGRGARRRSRPPAPSYPTCRSSPRSASTPTCAR